MTPHAYTENQLVEQPAIGLFTELGWQTVSALEATFGPSPPTPLPEDEGRIWLDRETKGEVVLTDRLRAALTRLNPGLPAEAIQTASDELARDRSAMSLVAANREIYRLLKEGIPVSVPDREALTPDLSPARGRGGANPGAPARGGQSAHRGRVGAKPRRRAAGSSRSRTGGPQAQASSCSRIAWSISARFMAPTAAPPIIPLERSEYCPQAQAAISAAPT